MDSLESPLLLILAFQELSNFSTNPTSITNTWLRIHGYASSSCPFAVPYHEEFPLLVTAVLLLPVLLFSNSFSRRLAFFASIGAPTMKPTINVPTLDCVPHEQFCVYVGELGLTYIFSLV